MSLDDSPFMKRVKARGSMGHGNKSEARVAKKMGSKLNPASGAMRGAKGDARLKGGVNFRIESKSTTATTIRIEKHWLNKIREEALAGAETPAVTISFVQGDGGSTPNGDWVMIPLSTFRELTE